MFARVQFLYPGGNGQVGLSPTSCLSFWTSTETRATGSRNSRLAKKEPLWVLLQPTVHYSVRRSGFRYSLLPLPPLWHIRIDVYNEFRAQCVLWRHCNVLCKSWDLDVLWWWIFWWFQKTLQPCHLIHPIYRTGQISVKLVPFHQCVLMESGKVCSLNLSSHTYVLVHLHKYTWKEDQLELVKSVYS